MFGARVRAPQEVIELAGGDMRLRLAPCLGGAVLNLTWRGQDLLRPTDPNAQHAMDAACFPLAPFANRIAKGRFSFGGRKVALKANYRSIRHVIHGYAWLTPWRVEETSPERARLTLSLAKGPWPWALACEQTISLSDAGARLELLVRNISDSAAPMSFGFHPAFVRPRGARLQAKVAGAWRVDKDALPTRLDPNTDLPDLATGTAVDAAPFIDQCHTGWDGRARLSLPGVDVDIAASPEFGFLPLYLPEGEDFLCIEPVSAMPDAFNRPQVANNGLRVLAPGEAASGSMLIAAAKAPA